jgi:hypothetical protein
MSDAKALRKNIMRALLWKEWRESWWLLILTVVAPPAVWLAAIPLKHSGFTPFTLPVWSVTMSVLMFLGAVLAARLFAGERARGSARSWAPTSGSSSPRPSGGTAAWLPRLRGL